MSRVRSQNSRPEMFVRRLVFALGYRYRLHVAGMPGRPDLVAIAGTGDRTTSSMTRNPMVEGSV